eukprot:162845_1
MFDYIIPVFRIDASKPKYIPNKWFESGLSFIKNVMSAMISVENENTEPRLYYTEYVWNNTNNTWYVGDNSINPICLNEIDIDNNLCELNNKYLHSKANAGGQTNL